jgi:hypothetical protein
MPLSLSHYTALDPAKPSSATQSIVEVCASSNANDVALWYQCVSGAGFGFELTTSGGTVEEPLTFVWTNGTQKVRATNTWSGGYLVQQDWSVSQVGVSFAAVCTQTYTYDGTGALLATTAAGGTSSFLWYAVGRIKALATALAAHIASTGTPGTMAAQNANAVAITGGSASLTIEREAKFDLGTVTSSVPINWALGGLATARISHANAAFTHQNLPSGVVGYLTLDLTINTVPSALLAGVKWSGGSPPNFTNGGRDKVILMCHDGATIDGSFIPDYR